VQGDRPGGGGEVAGVPGGGLSAPGVTGGGDGGTPGQQQSPESTTRHVLIPPLMERVVQEPPSNSRGGAGLWPSGH